MSAGLWNRGIEGGWIEGKDRSLSKGAMLPPPCTSAAANGDMGAGSFNRFVKATTHNFCANRNMRALHTAPVLGGTTSKAADA